MAEPGSLAPFRAFYYDGERGGAREVMVRMTKEGLAFQAPDRAAHDAQPDLSWPARDWRLAAFEGRQRAPHAFRLGHRARLDARLAFDGEARDAIAAHRPDLFDEGRGARRLGLLIGGLMAASVGLATLVFLGVPAISGPLARVTPRSAEIRMGENFASQINLVLRPCAEQTAARAIVSPIAQRMADENGVGFPITFRFVRASLPNAFALPGGQVMVTSALLDAVDDQEAFFAVLAHELGHVEYRHGMQAFYRNAGLGLGLEVIAGGSGLAQQAVTLAAQVQQLQYTRRDEAAADRAAIQILKTEKLDPGALGRALGDLTAFVGKASAGDSTDPAKKDKDGGGLHVRIPAWLQSHPPTPERIALAKAAAHPTGYRLLSDAQWATVRGACRSGG